MFRTKKKKAGNAVRKRKDLDDEDENVGTTFEELKSESMDVDEGEIPASIEPGVAQNDPETRGLVDGEEEESEDAVIERMRNRMLKSKGKAGASAMSFSSKPKKSGRVIVADDDEDDVEMRAGETPTTSTPGGCLSFEEDVGATKKKTSKKMKIRPNLSVAQAMEVDADDVETSRSTNLYSQDMLASLLREQKVLLRRPVEEPHRDAAFVIGVEGESTIDEEMKGDPAEEEGSAEEFIPLNAKLMKDKKNKKRVTFGVQNDEYYPPKTAEVEEPIEASDVEEDEEADQSKRWEEELMRRGGGHHVQQQQPRKAEYASKVPYPTRRKVACATLGEVMRSIQRKLDAGSIERDRVARELARLDVEIELIQKKLSQQREELLVSSEEFEYFQIIEDYVKGLSFCLREKLPVIEAEEHKIANIWTSSTEKSQTQRRDDVQAEIRLCLEETTVQERHFVNLPPQGVSAAAVHVDTSLEKEQLDSRLTRFKRRYEAPSEREPPLATFDVFVDAVEEMSSLRLVHGRFQEWKSKFPDVYKNAYTDLALAKLYGSYVRAELVYWDPLSVAGGSSASTRLQCRVSDMEWFKVLRQHHSKHNAELEEPVVSLVRETIVARVSDATKSRFDAFSSEHTQGVVDFIEDLVQLQAVPFVERGLEEIVANVYTSLTNEAKQWSLLALSDHEAGIDRVRAFASFLAGEFCALLENALTLFVALPSGSMHQRGFNAVMQILHQLLAYANHCKHTNKTAVLPQIQRTVQQLSSSSFMQSLLARSTREQFEFQRVLQLLTASTALPVT